MPQASTKLHAGDPAPDLFLTAINGMEVSLRACLLEGPVLIEFIRGTWCPNGRARLAELASARAAFRESGARVLVVVCEDPGTAARYFASNPSPLTVLIDSGRRVARDFGVYHRFGLGAWNIARPASFLIDRAGFLRTVFVSRLPIEAAPVEELLATLRALVEERQKLRGRPR